MLCRIPHYLAKLAEQCLESLNSRYPRINTNYTRDMPTSIHETVNRTRYPVPARQTHVGCRKTESLVAVIGEARVEKVSDTHTLCIPNLNLGNKLYSHGLSFFKDREHFSSYRIRLVNVKSLICFKVHALTRSEAIRFREDGQQPWRINDEGPSAQACAVPPNDCPRVWGTIFQYGVNLAKRLRHLGQVFV